jgi:hypothetical protein
MPIIKNMVELNSVSIESRPGIYMICLNRNIPKMRSDDKKGILYIGKSKNLADRLILVKREKWKSKLGKKSSYTFDHSALTYAVDFLDDGELVASPRLISDGVLKLEDRIALHVIYHDLYSEKEKQLLNAHVGLFGQLPPFNSHGSSLKAIGEGNHLELERSYLYFNEIYQNL